MRSFLPATLFSIAAACAMPASSSDATLCTIKSKGEEDFRVREVNLNAKAAERDLAILKKYEGQKVDGELAMAVFNASKRLQGYALRQAAIAVPNEKAKFCAWLEHESLQLE